MSAPQTQTILLLAANPRDSARLSLGAEADKIREGLRISKYRERFHIADRQAVKPMDIHRALLEHAPNVVHFSGHGEGEEGIVLENEQGRAVLVNAEALAQLFKLFGGEIRCVLLNACYSEVQAAAIAEHIDYVIGMNRAISDEAAISFAVAFYDALGAGKSIEFAFKLGCVAIQMQGIAEHLTPVLKKRSQTAVPAARLAPAETPQLARDFTVFLAEVADDLQSRRHALQSALEQMNITVLPPSMYFFPSLEALHAQLDHDLARADVYVQLLGASSPQRPPGVGMTTPLLQYQHARARENLALLQWRDPALDIDAVEDAEMRELLHGEQVIAGELEEFKQLIRRRLAALAAPPVTAARGGAENPARAVVFINAVPEDTPTAERFAAALEAAHVDYSLPLAGDLSPAECRRDLEDNLLDCDAVLVLYDAASLAWVREQLRYCRRLAGRRAAPFKFVAVLHPAEHPQPALGMSLPALRISAFNEADEECLVELVRELG